MTRTAVIAGAGPGLGASLARKFADEGCSVGLFARSGEYVSELAADLPTDAVGVEADIADPADVEAGFERVREELGPVDVLVNHASGGAWRGLTDISAATFCCGRRLNAPPLQKLNQKPSSPPQSHAFGVLPRRFLGPLAPCGRSRENN